MTARFSAEGDLRGSDQVARDLFRGLGPEFDCTLLASGPRGPGLGALVSGRIVPPSEMVPGAGTALYFRDSAVVGVPMKAAHRVARTFLGVAGRNPYASRLAETFRILGTPPVTPALLGYFRKAATDVVCLSAFSYAITLLGALAARKGRIPLVFTPYYHYRLPKFHDSPILRDMVAASSAVIACTDSERAALLEIGSDPARTFVVPPGFDPAAVSLSEAERSAAKDDLGLAGLFVVLAHPWVDKGILHVLPAVEKVAVRSRNVALLTMGQPDPEYVRARAQTLRRVPTLRIKDLGWVPGDVKWRAFAACDVFAMPSLTDAFGFSYMGAWALGKPIVAARGTSADSLVRNGEDGFLVEHDDEEAIARVLAELESDPTHGSGLGARGRARVWHEFTPRRFVEGYERVLRFAGSNRA